MLKTLSQPADREEIMHRLAQLTKQDAALWGIMSVHEMVCHLRDSYQVALGRKTARPATGLLQRTILKWLALKSPLVWPKGVKTIPEVMQGKGGSAPVDFALDRAALLSTLEQFCEQLTLPCVPHAIFGKMTVADWMRWGYLHADHHLRQFGN